MDSKCNLYEFNKEIEEIGFINNADLVELNFELVFENV